LSASTRSEEALAQSSERRLTRLMLDLHDGPLQDLAALGGEVQTLKAHCLAGELTEEALGERLDDLHAWVRATDADLRRLSTGAGAPLLLIGAFEDLLRQLTDGFTARSGIGARIEVHGPVGALRDVQRVAVLRIIQQALANVRQHAEAGQVVVTVRMADDHLTATVEDDGMGFDVEAVLAAGPDADGQHQGLVGMRERARLLGGHLVVTSRPGGPTTITLRLPVAQDRTR
jgi:signal transduction histidine kinase